MFERLTVGTKDVVLRASDEARGLGNDFIGTEHLLLGLIAEGGAAGRVLSGGGLTSEGIRRRLGRAPGVAGAAGQTLPFTKPALTALDRAAHHAAEAGVAQVSPEHLLRGIVDTAEGVTAELLEAAGVALPPPGPPAEP